MAVLSEQAVVVILAAGKGTRMGREDRAKVCFEIDGVAAINRIIETFKRCRFGRFLVVVGALAEQVMTTVARDHPEAVFVYQSPQWGTGHAGRVAAEALQGMGHAGPVLMTLGDKYIEREAIEQLVDGYVKQQADLALLTVPRTRSAAASSGRVLVDGSGQAVGIIERVDLARQAIADELRERMKKGTPDRKAVQETIRKHLPKTEKQSRAAGELLGLGRTGERISRKALATVLEMEKYNLTVDGRRYTSRQIERRGRQFNPSLYLFGAEVFYRGMALLENDNAQGEYYVTDVVKRLGEVMEDGGERRYRVRTVAAERAEVIQGFNSPDELLSIQDYVRRRKKVRPRDRAVAGGGRGLKKSQYAAVADWLKKVEGNGAALKRWLRRIYGEHPELHERKRRELRKVLRCYGRRFGFEEKVVIVRAPGRINLMGRHVDHRGGYNNFLALNRETIAVAGRREDDTVVAVNTDPKWFKPQQFGITDQIGRFAWDDWVNFINSDWVRSLLQSGAGQWGNYLKAAVLRVQHKYQDVKLRGMNVALTGSVPMAAGLSSSSTLVVAALRATIALNQLELDAQQFVDLCGEGEWFVGSRGGAGDHAAITLGQRGKVVQVGYYPFRVGAPIDAPRDYQVMIADSHVKAAKSAAAKSQFNGRVAAYNLGLALLRQRSPEAARMVEHVRDLNPQRLGSTSAVYRLLGEAPERMTRKEFEQVLSGEHKEMMAVSFSSHRDPVWYPVRGVLLFGAAECRRSQIGIELLARGEVERFGELMTISHDGDRVSRAGRDGRYAAWQAEASDAALHRLIGDLASEDPERVRGAQLERQPGCYGCSTEEIGRASCRERV